MDKKRLLVSLMLLVSVIVGLILYIVLSGEFSWDVIVIIIIIIVLFLAYAIPKFILNRGDKVSDDEFSKQMLRLAAARSFMISLYTWLALMMFDDIFEDTSTQIGMGIAIMAIIFFINILVIKYTGVKD